MKETKNEWKTNGIIGCSLFFLITIAMLHKHCGEQRAQKNRNCIVSKLRTVNISSSQSVSQSLYFWQEEQKKILLNQLNCFVCDNQNANCKMTILTKPNSGAKLCPKTGNAPNVETGAIIEQVCVCFLLLLLPSFFLSLL